MQYARLKIELRCFYLIPMGKLAIEITIICFVCETQSGENGNEKHTNKKTKLVAKLLNRAGRGLRKFFNNNIKTSSNSYIIWLLLVFIKLFFPYFLSHKQLCFLDIKYVTKTFNSFVFLILLFYSTRIIND